MEGGCDSAKRAVVHEKSDVLNTPLDLLEPAAGVEPATF
jgi:hypothetical protein